MNAVSLPSSMPPVAALNMEPVDDVNMELAGRVLYQVQNDLLPLAYISSRTSSRRALKLKPSGITGV